LIANTVTNKTATKKSGNEIKPRDIEVKNLSNNPPGLIAAANPRKIDKGTAISAVVPANNIVFHPRFANSVPIS
jgi:hypothetical protein